MSKNFEVTVRSEFRVTVKARDANKAQKKALKIVKETKKVDGVWIVSLGELK